MVNVLVKGFGTRLPAAEAAFLRFAIGLVFIVPILPKFRGLSLTSAQLRLLGFRGIVHACAIIFWFYAMARLPLAEVISLNYLNPIFVTLGGVLFFAERFSWRRGMALGAALLGALVILRPGFRELQPALSLIHI